MRSVCSRDDARPYLFNVFTKFAENVTNEGKERPYLDFSTFNLVMDIVKRDLDTVRFQRPAASQGVTSPHRPGGGGRDGGRKRSGSASPLSFGGQGGKGSPGSGRGSPSGRLGARRPSLGGGGGARRLGERRPSVDTALFGGGRRRGSEPSAVARIRSRRPSMGGGATAHVQEAGHVKKGATESTDDFPLVPTGSARAFLLSLPTVEDESAPATTRHQRLFFAGFLEALARGASLVDPSHPNVDSPGGKHVS